MAFNSAKSYNLNSMESESQKTHNDMSQILNKTDYRLNG